MIARSKLGCGAALLAILSGIPAAAQMSTVRVGTVLDGAADRELAFREAVRKESIRLLGGRHDVSFPPEKQMVGNWTAETSRRHLSALLADPEVDAVLVLGIVGASQAARAADLPKPVIAAPVLNPEVEGLPVEVRERPTPGRESLSRHRVSGVRNLSYVSYNQDLEREIREFRKLAPFSRLAVLTIPRLEESLRAMRGEFRRRLAPMGIAVDFIVVGNSADAALDALPPDTEAVILGLLSHLSPGEFEQLIAGLIEKRLPSYALAGRTDVQRGAMASLKLDRSEQSFVRRVALNLFNIVQGEAAAELPIDFSVGEQLTLNLTTASAIGVDLKFSTLTDAELLGEAAAPAGRLLSLSAVVEDAVKVNLDLAAAGKRIDAGLRLVSEARAPLLPRVSVSGGGSKLAGAGAVFGDRQLSGSLGFSQLLYSERVRAGYDVERQSQIAREEEAWQLRLDIVLEAAQSYLDVLRAKTYDAIQRNNLQLSRSNLSLARRRFRAGATGRDEVLRWRSEIARNRLALLEASARRKAAEIAVNRVLNRSLEEPFQTSEAGLADPGLTVNFERLRPYIERRGAFGLFRQFMTFEALDGSPELRRLDASIRARKRIVLASKRALYLPELGLDAQVQGQRSSGGLSLFPEGLGGGGTDWSISVRASLPLFEGGALRARRSRAQIELEEMAIERTATRLAIEQRVRSALLEAGVSFAGIELAQEAASAARENFELVRNSYSQGVVGIIRVLDAQSQMLAADLSAANAVFDHLIHLMAVQRAVGRFDYFRSPAERDAWLRRLEKFYRERGRDVHTD